MHWSGPCVQRSASATQCLTMNETSWTRWYATQGMGARGPCIANGAPCQAAYRNVREGRAWARVGAC
eukprot:2286077-Pleurochrysis_carterae.AAC.1